MEPTAADMETAFRHRSTERSYDDDGPVKAADNGPVAILVNMLDGQLESLNKATSMLHEALNPVMDQRDTATPGIATAERVQTSSVLGTQLTELLDRAEALTRRVHTMRDRLEL